MSDPIGQPLGSHIMLTETNASQWKDAIIDKAIIIDAYRILMGTETLSTVGNDPAALVSFRARQSQLAGNISSTLNEGHHVLVRNATPKIAPDDARGIWDFIVNNVESKTTNSRLFAAQEMIALWKGDAGHENKTYSAYGACFVSQGNVFKNLLPAGPTFIAESVAQGKAMPSDIGFVSSRFSEGFGARDLVDELTISMIIIGLGFNEKDRQPQSTLMHIGIGSLARILEALRNADTLVYGNR